LLAARRIAKVSLRPAEIRRFASGIYFMLLVKKLRYLVIFIDFAISGDKL
jgi:hypothetical protein